MDWVKELRIAMAMHFRKTHFYADTIMVNPVILRELRKDAQPHGSMYLTQSGWLFEGARLIEDQKETTFTISDSSRKK